MMTMNNNAPTSHYIDINGSKMHYLEQGQGNPILFLHGMPTSSYLWRNIIPHLAPLGRCIAPDLIGMGKSAKPDIEYSIADHIKYIEKFIETLQLKNIILVMHGWGSIVGFDIAMRHEALYRGFAFYEAYLRPFDHENISLPFQEQLISLEEHEEVWDPLMNGAYFIDKVLPQGMITPLAEADMRHYREPFLAEGTGRPLHQYVQEMPRGTGQSEVDNLIAGYSKKLTQSKLPKLMLYSIPGFITTISTAIWARENLQNIELVEIGEELHYAQESNPALMGETISIWVQGVEQMV
jgi:haloalkane dehalogenase